MRTVGGGIRDGLTGGSGGFDPDHFDLPHQLEAAEPPEARGLSRDGIRLMVARRTPGGVKLEHRHFRDLPELLDAGDVVVVNTSATLAASIPGVTSDAEPVAVALSGRLPGGAWAVELRHRHPGRGDAYGTSPWLDARGGVVVHLPDGGRAQLTRSVSGSRLWSARLDLPNPLLVYLARHGHPVRYPYVTDEWPISAYQTVFAEEPGSAEMPSAARPFSSELVTRLVSRGVVVAPFVLHCGVSSLESHEPPQAEWFRVGRDTARLVNSAHEAGHRVIAVGTTAVRALETVADADRRVHADSGWTDLVIGPHHAIRAVDGLVTGWHEPGASHLALLKAVGGQELVAASYAEAITARYLWHEFGDSHLILP
ncbi:MAG: S-adenosylmethionine:tRNA ribosyltransferase-isomerase [Acidimicrobiaceae bacterium]|nr:S-adenosylmethionine:tRNA ribosyltransferase-isomerase [Acidimicrobiaceae bacterium]MBO0746814.1 S-adenosylmethionine:tRNA ribosyltransferase-isomerase [Acidimicrobiaceae bacterium]